MEMLAVPASARPAPAPASSQHLCPDHRRPQSAVIQRALPTTHPTALRKSCLCPGTGNRL